MEVQGGKFDAKCDGGRWGKTSRPTLCRATATTEQVGHLQNFPTTPAMIPNLDLMYRASRRRVMSRARPQRPHTATVCRTRKRSKGAQSTGSVDSLESRPRSQAAESDIMFDMFDFKFDDNYNLSDDDIAPSAELLKETVSQRAYRRACARLGVIPCSTLTKGLTEATVNLRNRSFGPKDAKACAIGLVLNKTVKTLDYGGNSIGAEGAKYLAEVLVENIYLSDLLLSECNLGSNGVEILSEALKQNETIHKLDLSGNNLEEKDGAFIADILQNNPIIRELYIGHNNFREEGGKKIGNALADTTSLEILDLSWNHLRRRGAIAICEGVQKNMSITKLDLSWNGLHYEGCRALARTLLHNYNLTDLDITSNRINKDGLNELLKGLKNNEVLISLKLGSNPLGTEGAVSLLKTLQGKPGIKLKHIDLTGQNVDVDFLKQLKKVRETRPLLCVKHGYIMRLDPKTGVGDRDVFLDEDPMTVLLEFMRLQNLRLVDLFSSLDEDGSKTLTREEFSKGLRKVNIPLSYRALQNLVKRLDQNGDGEIDMGELMAGQREHKRKLAKVMEKSKDLPFEETPLGVLSSKLQTMMQLSTVMKMKVNQANRMKRLSLLGGLGGSKPLLQVKGQDKAQTGASLISSAVSKLQTAERSSLPASEKDKLLGSSEITTTSNPGFISPVGARTPIAFSTPAHTSPVSSRAPSANKRRPKSTIPGGSRPETTSPLPGSLKGKSQRPMTAYPSKNKMSR